MWKQGHFNNFEEENEYLYDCLAQVRECLGDDSFIDNLIGYIGNDMLWKALDSIATDHELPCAYDEYDDDDEDEDEKVEIPQEEDKSEDIPF